MDPSAMKEAFSSIGQDRVDAGKQRLRLLPDGRLVTSFVTEERLEELMNFEHSTSDVWITTYPKSGTTWCQYVAFLLAGNEPGQRPLCRRFVAAAYMLTPTYRCWLHLQGSVARGGHVVRVAARPVAGAGRGQAAPLQVALVVVRPHGSQRQVTLHLHHA